MPASDKKKTVKLVTTAHEQAFVDERQLFHFPVGTVAPYTCSCSNESLFAI